MININYNALILGIATLVFIGYVLENVLSYLSFKKREETKRFEIQKELEEKVRISNLKEKAEDNQEPKG